MTISLEQISMAKPCSANWAEMSGDERTRHCGACKLNVYNISDMTRDDAEKLIREKEGKLCVRLFKRTDGTVITQDCPVGLARLRKKMAVFAGLIAASIFSVITVVLSEAGYKPGRGNKPAQAIKDWLNNRPTFQVVMGTPCLPPKPVPPPTPPAPVPTGITPTNPSAPLPVLEVK